jgi:hypothetical protein
MMLIKRSRIRLQMITADQLDELQHKIDWEGFDYCFNGYSRWSEIEDENFHAKLKLMIQAKKDFVDYLIELGLDADEF